MFLFFFNDTATTEIYTLALHDALPILGGLTGQLRDLDRVRPVRLLRTAGRDLRLAARVGVDVPVQDGSRAPATVTADRKSTRLNSSHANISYAVFCLKKKKH